MRAFAATNIPLLTELKKYAGFCCYKYNAPKGAFFLISEQSVERKNPKGLKDH